METAQVRPPLFTNKALVNLTIPVIIESLLAIMAGIVDSAMVSTVGEAAVSGIALVDSINVLFISFISAIAIGGAVVTSQYIGSRNYAKARSSARQLLYAAFTISTVLMIALLCLRKPLLRLIYGNLDADVFTNADTYFFYTLLGYPFFALGCSSTAVLRSMGKTRSATVITVSTNLFNVFGNAVLIYGFHLGVAGAAISTTCCRILFAILGQIFAHNKELPAYFEHVLKFQLDWDVMSRVLRIGVTNGLENSLFQIGKILISSLVSSFGTVYIAANSVAFSINNIGWSIVASFGTVLLTVVGQCIGAGEPEQAKAYSRKFFAVATLCVYVLFGGVFLLRHQLVKLYDFGPETMEVAAYYTGFCALLPMLSFYAFSFLPMSVFRAAGDIRYAMTVSVVSMFAFRVASCYLLNFLFPNLGLMCVFIGMWADWVFRSILNFFHYRSGKWLKKSLI